MNRKNSLLFPDTKNGIYLYEYPMINGIKQYVQVRGKDRKNPLVLFLHGGPGGSVAGVCHIHQEGWEDKFTVANWDQRNTCKTYCANKDKAQEIALTGTMEDFVKDIDEVIAYLHTVYEFDKLILMGFSWGSAIGSEYAKRYPENILCYIGIGQHVCYRDGVLTTCQRLLELVPNGSKDEEEVKRIVETFPQKPVWNKELFTCMRLYTPLCTKYIIRHGKRISLSKIMSSPFMNFREKKSVMFLDYSKLTQSYATMLDYDFRQNMQYEVPLLFIFGDEETVCPSKLVEDCFDMISAPKKKIEIIPQASHACYLDNAQAFMSVVETFLKSLSA